MKHGRAPFFLLLLFLVACKKDISNPVSQLPTSTFSETFDAFWNQLNVNYCYWDIDTTDWDAVYIRYKPVFSSLQLEDTADLARSVSYFREMTDGLIDHHFSISFTNGVLKDSSINPAHDQLLKDAAFRNPYSYLGRDQRYLDTGYIYGFDNVTDAGNTLLTLSGTIHGNILFFTCNQFSLSASFQSAVSSSVLSSLNFFFQRLKNPAGLKAILLDFRDNLGGSVDDLNFLAGQFIDKPLHFGFTRYKSGNGRLDYTPWIDANVLPQSATHAIALPVIVLADKYSASMAELMTMALRALPQCRIVGETTFGATGPFAPGALYNDGPFDLPGFLSVVSSSAEFKYVDGKIYEGKGFPPDYNIPFNAAAVSSGDDPQMNKALSLIE